MATNIAWKQLPTSYTLKKCLLKIATVKQDIQKNLIHAAPFSDVVQLAKQKKRGGKKGAGRVNGRVVMLSNVT